MLGMLIAMGGDAKILAFFGILVGACLLPFAVMYIAYGVARLAGMHESSANGAGVLFAVLTAFAEFLALIAAGTIYG